jgi:hypothetical protein
MTTGDVINNAGAFRGTPLFILFHEIIIKDT